MWAKTTLKGLGTSSLKGPMISATPMLPAKWYREKLGSSPISMMRFEMLRRKSNWDSKMPQLLEINSIGMNIIKKRPLSEDSGYGKKQL